MCSSDLFPSHDTVKLKLKNGPTIEITPDHPIKTRYGWEEAGNLEPGDFVEYINSKSLCKKQHLFNLNYDLGYFLGAVASDGSIQDDRRICIEVNSLDFAEKIKKSIFGAFGLYVNIQEIEKPSGFLKKSIKQYRVRFVSSQIAKRCVKLLGLPFGLGNRSKTKKFHFPIVALTDWEIMSGFLDANRDDMLKAMQEFQEFIDKQKEAK